jgi:hypothetical protein
MRPRVPLRKELSQIELEVDDVENVEAFVNQADVAADDDIAVVGRAGRQALNKFSRHGMDSMPQILVEDDAYLKPGFDFRRQPVTITESFWQTVVVFVVPTAGGLAIMVFESRMVVVFISVAILSERAAHKR